MKLLTFLNKLDRAIAKEKKKNPKWQVSKAEIDFDSWDQIGGVEIEDGDVVILTK